MWDPVQVIEAAYACELDQTAWVRAMVDAVAPFLSLPRSMGVMGWIYDHSELEAPTVHDYTSVGASARLHSGVKTLNELPRRGALLEGAQRASFGRHLPIGSTAALLAGEALEKWWLPSVRKLTGATTPSIRDFVAIHAIERPQIGLMIGTPLPEPLAIDDATFARWSKLCAHIATAMRLRRRLRATSLDPGDNEAVLTTTGRVEHASGQATARRATQELIVAAKAIDRARGKLRKHDPDEAVATWRGLVEGRWSLVDYGVEGTRRYLVAKENLAPTRDPGQLSPRQRQVLFFVCQGHSNKLIAYELGLTPASVATHIRRASQKLGVRTHAELVARAYTLLVGGADDDEAT